MSEDSETAREPAGTEYRTLRYSDAAEWDAPVPDMKGSWEDALKWDGAYVMGIWRFDDGVPREFVGSDGGEPEDQTLGRDWSWVVDALNAAYALGNGHSGSKGGNP